MSSKTSWQYLEATINQFPNRLKEILGNASIREFSRSCSLSEATLRDYLAGNSYPTLDRLDAIAKAGNVPIEWLVIGDTVATVDRKSDLIQVIGKLSPRQRETLEVMALWMIEEARAKTD